MFAGAPTYNLPRRRLASMNIPTKTLKDRGFRVIQAVVVAASLLFGLATTVEAQIGVNTGFDLGALPTLVLIPGYPVYYDQQADSNYFFYGDMYWVYSNNNWYSSGWYNGPWQTVSSYDVPLFVLRVPVTYYRRPPAFFRGWGRDAPPHWGEHYDSGWELRRTGWDQWNHAATRAPAKLPEYQRQYTKEHYPATVPAAKAHPSESDKKGEEHDRHDRNQ